MVLGLRTAIITLLLIVNGCYVKAEAPTKGFLFRARCSSTETERAERMVVIGTAATLIVHDATLWRQTEPLINTACELGLFEGEP